MNKVKFLFVLAVIVVLNKKAVAQQSIIPDISEVYLEKLISVAKTNYPRVKANQAKVDIAKSNISKAKVSYLDAFTFSYIYQPQGINTLSNASGTSQNYNYFNGIQAGLFFNLGTFLEKPSMVKAAKGDLEVANSEQDEYFLTLTNDVKKRYYLYIENIANLKLLTQACQDALNVSNDIKHKFERGEETFDNYTKAQLNLTTSYQQKIAAETNLLISKSDLEELLGEKLEDIK